MSQNLAVCVKDVKKQHGSLQVLEGINLEVEKGTIYGLLGPSGCGKTTLLSILVGRKKFDQGDIHVLGNIVNEQKSSVLGARVGYMPQELALVESLTVEDTLFYFGRIYGMTDKLISERYHDLHSLLELPPSDRYIAECSGGQKRRVSFAAAVVHKPELLILDEPTVGVDPLLREKIWKYIVELTKKENITVIVTTHYIEECRQADKIGLMRGGRILVEENPYKLMAHYNSQSLEEVFLLLCKQQDGKRGNITETKRIPQLGSEKTRKTISSFHMDKRIEEITQRRNKPDCAINKRHLRALLDKNWKQFYRNKTGILFLFFIPTCILCLFLSGVGGNIKDIPLGIVNGEVESCSAQSDLDPPCQLSNKSCQFLNHLNHPMISKVPYDDLDVAKEGVRRGLVAGALYISENFTSLFQQRMDKGVGYTEYDNQDLNQVKVWMDMSNSVIGEGLKYKLMQLYLEFEANTFHECGYSPKIGGVPVKFNMFYGEGNEAKSAFMLPGIFVTILFTIGAVLTCHIIVSEKEEGTWDRSIIAGVTSLEITISHLILQAGLAVIPIVGIMCFAFLIYQYDTIGSVWLLFLILYATELSGMSYGYFVSVVANSTTMSYLLLCGSINTVVITSGMLWPLEGMPTLLWLLTMCMPFTIPIIATTNVIRKGWTIDHVHVMDGILVCLLWILIFGIFSVFIMKRAR